MFLFNSFTDIDTFYITDILCCCKNDNKKRIERFRILAFPYWDVKRDIVKEV